MATICDPSPTRLLLTTDRQLSWKVVAAGLKTEVRPRLRYIQIKPFSRFILFPDDRILTYWGGFMFALLVYVAIVTPYRVALVSVDSQSWLITDTVVDGLFFLDLLVNTVLAYYDEEGNLVTSHKRIFMRYLKTWMCIDLLSCIPVEYIGSDYNNFVRLSRLPRMYRLIRMFRLMRMLKLIKHRSSVMRYMTMVFRISIGMERLFWFAVTLVMILHLIACTWVFVGSFNADIDSKNWIAVFEFNDKSDFELYLISLYWTITTVSTIGYGDIYAVNNLERVMNSIIMLIGVLTYSYMIGSLTNVLSSLDSRNAKLKRNLEYLVDLSKEYNLGKSFYSKLSNAVEYEHKNNNRDLEELINSLPSNLRNQLLLAIYQKKIENNVFFEGRSEHFVAWIVPMLKSILYADGEYIYQEGDLSTEMFFLIKGEVDFVMRIENLEVTFVSMTGGYYFGEIELLFSKDKLRLHTTKSKDKLEMLGLKETDLSKLIHTFENEALEILSLAEERKKRLDQRKQSAVENFKVRRRVSRQESQPLSEEMRKLKAAEFKKQLEQAIDPPSGLGVVKEESLGHISGVSSSENPDPSEASSVHNSFRQTRHPKRRSSLLNAPMFERLKTKMLGTNKKSSIQLQKQVNELAASVTDMRELIIQLCVKFNLPHVNTGESRRPSRQMHSERTSQTHSPDESPEKDP